MARQRWQLLVVQRSARVAGRDAPLVAQRSCGALVQAHHGVLFLAKRSSALARARAGVLAVSNSVAALRQPER
jgi:hypothetical protein